MNLENGRLLLCRIIKRTKISAVRDSNRRCFNVYLGNDIFMNVGGIQLFLPISYSPFSSHVLIPRLC